MSSPGETQPAGGGQPASNDVRATKSAYTVQGRVLEIGHYGKTKDRAIYIMTKDGKKSGGKLLLRKDSEISADDLFNDPGKFINAEVIVSVVQSGMDYSVVGLKLGDRLPMEWYRPHA